ncbi:MAG: hypothetical protein QM495_08125 [Lutibacter sp.]|uniref:hypothetical protein n=1 Tax=Lutibacter sp. TaxID=1925666 RepID=UPI0038587DA3
MKKKSKIGLPVSRRGILPILGSSLLIPFLGIGKTLSNSNSSLVENNNEPDDEYQTLLRPDGTTVKVKKSVIKDAEVVKKNISNHSFLNWLSNKK